MKNVNPNTELLKLLKEGDVSAFNVIYNKYCHKLHEFVLMYLKQEEDAEEVVQEVFIKIWKSRMKIDIYSSFESFLFTIAYNSTMSLLRKRVSETKSKAFFKSLQQIDNTKPITDEIQFKELCFKVESLIKRLTPRQKEIYRLSRDEGLTHKEIAHKLSISESTVNNHLVTILRYFKVHMDNDVIISVLFLHLFLL